MSYFDPIDPERIRELVAVIDTSTEAEADLAARYTTMKRIVIKDVPEARTVWLRVGVQSFPLNGYVDSPEEGASLCWMLAKAIRTIRSEG